MNSTELYIAASEKIEEWQKDHNSACILSVKGGKVICTEQTDPWTLRNDPLHVSKFEVARGMNQRRWTAIGTALHNLYCKELKCQALQKPTGK